MNKQSEIDILREAAAKLGVKSYCGPWLTDQIDGIARDIGNDHFPQMDRAAAMRECEQIKANAEAWAKEKLGAADRIAKAKIDAAHQEACGIRGRILGEIRKVQTTLGVAF